MHRKSTLTGTIAALTLVLAGMTATRADEKPAPTFGPSPRLATTAQELAAEKERADFPAKRDAAIADAAPLVKDPVALPDGYGSWTFYYACPDDGTDLRMLTSTEHECPKCKKRYSDERTIAAYRCQMHYQAENAALQLAWAYAYTNDNQYASQTRRILVHLADKYHTYPARLDRWGRTGRLAPLGGRRFVQSLDEAVGVIRLAKSYDLTRDAKVWSDEDRRHVEEDLFRATAKTLLEFNQGINNHQTWYNAGLMAIAAVLGDAELVERVLTMRGGFHDQLARSLGDDGIWYEGTMAYQNYALQAMVEIVDASRRMGVPLHETARFKQLLESSLKVAYPNGEYPAINDSDPGGFRNFGWSYDWAWQTYREPRYAQAAAWGDAAKLAALLGPDAKAVWPLETKSLNLPDVGLAILRVGDGPSQNCVFFDYGRHGDGHGHYDKLNITLFAAGREWLVDTGRIGYTYKEYKTWVKHTVAHNTIVVNEESQSATTGKLRWLEANDKFAACAGECETAYVGVKLQRHLLLTRELLVDVYDVAALRPVQIDWLAHAVTEPLVPVSEVGAAEAMKLGDSSGYEHLQEGRRWPAAKASRWEFPAGKQRLRMWFTGDANDELLTAIGIGQTVEQKAPAILRRRRDARTARFATVYDLSGDGRSVTGVELLEGQFPGLKITTPNTAIEVTFSASGVTVR
jgi:hypothetical protein